MATNLEELKAQIAEMSAEEFENHFAMYLSRTSSRAYCKALSDGRETRNCNIRRCSHCRVKWLKNESCQRAGPFDKIGKTSDAEDLFYVPTERLYADDGKVKFGMCRCGEILEFPARECPKCHTKIKW